MEIDELFGLPAHPLIVHVPVVVVPLALVATLVALWRPARRPAVLAAAAFALVGGAGVIAATWAGEPFEERVGGSDRIDEHSEAGEAARLPAAAFAVVAVGAVVAVEAARRVTDVDWPAEPGASRMGAEGSAGRQRWLPVAALVVSVVVGGVATLAVVDAGHSGATALWEDLPATGDDRGPGDGDGD